MSSETASILSLFIRNFNRNAILSLVITMLGYLHALSLLIRNFNSTTMLALGNLEVVDHWGPRLAST